MSRHDIVPAVVVPVARLFVTGPFASKCPRLRIMAAERKTSTEWVAWASSPGGRQVVQAAEAGRAAAKRARSIAAGLNTTPNRTGNLRSPRAGGLSSKGKGGAAARTRVTGMRMETVSVPVS